MNDLWAIACGTGLQDGINPCIFVTCTAFIVHGLWLNKRSLRIAGLRIIFVLVYAAGTLVFNFGPAQIFIFNKGFIFAAKILYFILGVMSFVLGVLFLKDWFLKSRGPAVQDQAGTDKKPMAGGSLVAVLATIILSLALSALATLWPVNNYILLLGNVAFIKGQWLVVIPLLLGYVFFSMWPLWLVWGLLSIKNLRPSFLKIICAAIFFIASSSVIFIFK